MSAGRKRSFTAAKPAEIITADDGNENDDDSF